MRWYPQMRLVAAAGNPRGFKWQQFYLFDVMDEMNSLPDDEDFDVILSAALSTIDGEYDLTVATPLGVMAADWYEVG